MTRGALLVAMRNFLSRFCIFIVSVLSVAATALHAQPELHVGSGGQMQLGEIYAENLVHTKVPLTNSGKDTLLLGEIESTCGCTVGQTLRKFIPPGGSDTIDITFNTHGYNGFVKKDLFLHSNDPVQPKAMISLIATVGTLYHIEPALLKFGATTVGVPITRKMKVVSESDDTLKIVSIRPSDPSITVRPSKGIIRPHGAIELAVTVRPKRTGSWLGNLIIEFNDARERFTGVSFGITVRPSSKNVMGR